MHWKRRSVMVTQPNTSKRKRDPFHELILMVCAIIILPHVIVLALYVLFSLTMHWMGIRL